MADQLSHPDPREVMARADAFVRANLAQCARELIAWDRTAILPSGTTREAAAILSALGGGDHLSLARRLVEKLALIAAAGGDSARRTDQSEPT